MPKQYPSPPALAIDGDKKYTATFHTSMRQDQKLSCSRKEAPMTVNNFHLSWRVDKFYDGTTFFIG